MSNDRRTDAYQRPITPIERWFMRSPFAIVTLVPRIRGNVTEGMVREAVARVRIRHRNLRCRIAEDEHGTPWLTSEGSGEIAITTLPRESDGHWMRVVSESCQVPFEFEARPAIRFILVQGAAVSELAIVCHHILCDGLSLAYLARDLMVHLGDPAREAEPLPDAVPVGLDNLPKGVSANALVRWVIGRTNQKWAAEKVVFDQEDYRELTGAYWARYPHQALNVELSEEETTALLERCRSAEVTVNSALSAAFVGAQVLVQGAEPFHSSAFVAGSLRDRLPRPPGEAMGFYAGSVTAKFRYDTCKALWENAREFQRIVRPLFTDKNLFGALLTWCYLDPTLLEAMNFKKLGALVPEGAARHDKLAAFHERDDTVLRILRRERIDTLEQVTTGTAITNLGRLDFPRQYGALELERLTMNPGGGFPLVNFNLVLGAVTCAGKLSLLVEWVTDNVEVSTMEEIKDRALDSLSH